MRSHVFPNKVFGCLCCLFCCLLVMPHGAMANSGGVENPSGHVGYGGAQNGSTIIIDDSTHDWIYGYSDFGTSQHGASGNTVFINDGAIVKSVRGGNSVYNADVSNNTVNVNGGTITEGLYGGEGGNVSNNSINITSGNLGGEYFYELAGGKGSTAQGNDVTISGGYISVQGIYGGLAYSDEASNNRVTITGGTVYGPVYGGKGSKSAYNNTVTISGSTIKPYTYVDSGRIVNVYGGFSDSAASAINNTVRLSGAPDLSVVSLYGGNDESRTGNTLEVHTKNLTAYNVNNFANYHFYLPGNIQAGDTVLKLTDTAGTNISGSQVAVGMAGGTSPLKLGESVFLITNDNGLTSDNISTGSLHGKQGVSLDYEFGLSSTGTSLIATATKVPTDLNPQTKAFPEGHLGSMITLLQGADLIAGEGTEAAKHATSLLSDTKIAFNIFTAMSAGWSRYNTGSHTDVRSFSLVAGPAIGIDLDLGRLTLGAFYEYGTGISDTYNSFSNAPSVHGDGDVWYVGGGLLTRMDFTDSGPGNFYAEASARAGRVHNDYENSDMRDYAGRIAEYSTSLPYYSIHAGLGYIWNIKDSATLEMYGKYFWTHQPHVSTSLSTGEPVDFDSVDSHRMRLGSRLTYPINAVFKPFLGVAWEHEFDGRSSTRIHGLPVSEPSLEGDTGIGEIGFTLSPSERVPVDIDFTMNGYTGMREGVGGSVVMKIKF